MPGPPPKDPKIRQRQNVKRTVELRPNPDALVPELPNHDARSWHPLALAWWSDLWKSPMASEYLPTDAHTLAMLAVLVDDYFKAKSPRERRDLAAEIRQQGARFGITPADRARLGWTIADPDESKPAGTAAGDSGPDPRKYFKLISTNKEPA